MIRSTIRELTNVFPLFMVLGSLAFCASGLVAFDASLALVRGGTAPTSVSELRAARRAAAAKKVPTVVKKKVNGRYVEVEQKSRRLLESSGDSATTGAKSSVEYVRARCGDKLILLGEACDDGNTTAGDGCSEKCTIESGYTCTRAQPSFCSSRCGDGLIVSGKEDCDDGNDQSGDGCSPTCRIEPGYGCSGTPSTCALK